MKSGALLIIFVRNPRLGKVKKRLAKKIGEHAALEIYKTLLNHTKEITKNLKVVKEIHYSETLEAGDLWKEPQYKKVIQFGNHLGARMENAFKKGFEEGYRKIVLIGSDLLHLDQEDLEKAFESLETSDYVLGPAIDGGYYLIGMKSLNSKVFRNKNWSTDSVLKDTIKDLENEITTLLEERNDIDVQEDLQHHPTLQQILKNINDKINSGNR